MTTLNKHFDPEALSQLQSLTLRGRWLLDGYLQGLHAVPADGRSTEFSQHRPYAQGDDRRHLDWKVFARTDRYYVRQFENESNLAAMMMLDASPSMAYRGTTAALSKWEYAQLVLVTLSIHLLRQRDAVGVISLGSDSTPMLEPSTEPSQWTRIVAAVDRSVESVKEGGVGSGGQEGSGSWGLAGLEKQLARVKRRSLLVWISDFLDEVEGWRPVLSRMRHSGHDVLAIQVLDRDEREFPFERNAIFRGMEGEGEEQVEGWSIRGQYLANLERHQRAVRDLFQEFGYWFESLTTDQSLADCLSMMLSKRQGVVRSGASGPVAERLGTEHRGIEHRGMGHRGIGHLGSDQPGAGGDG